MSVLAAIKAGDTTGAGRDAQFTIEKCRPGTDYRTSYLALHRRHAAWPLAAQTTADHSHTTHLLQAGHEIKEIYWIEFVSKGSVQKKTLNL